jgi:hypothetical protein
MNGSRRPARFDAPGILRLEPSPRQFQIIVSLNSARSDASGLDFKLYHNRKFTPVPKAGAARHAGHNE